MVTVMAPLPLFQALLFTFITVTTTPTIQSLSQDGALLLSFKFSVLSDPLNALKDWNYRDTTPCSWNGVECAPFADATIFNWTTNRAMTGHFITTYRVVSLVLPNCKLFGSVPAELAMIEHIQRIDLSGNALNGTLSPLFFNSSELHTISLAGNEISGDFPDFIGFSGGLRVLNLSENALTGALPENLTLLSNLTVLCLANNYISGELPSGAFRSLEFLDLSSNLVNGSIPDDLVGGQRLKFLNLSYNRLSGRIPASLGSKVWHNAIIDFSYNNLSGSIPNDSIFIDQRSTSFVGNPELCGAPLKTLCSIPSIPSNISSSTVPLTGKSPPAFAAIPKDTEGTKAGNGGNGGGSLRPAAIVAITVGDMAGIWVLLVVFLYVYQLKKRKEQKQIQKQKHVLQDSMGSPVSKRIDFNVFSCCLNNGKTDGDDTETSISSEAEVEDNGSRNVVKNLGLNSKSCVKSQYQKRQQVTNALVNVDGEVELELETLLKASAYILGATGSSIVYKAVLADGTSLAVRRIGESTVIDKLKDFEAQVRSIAKFIHLNLLRICGFYWGPAEKLIIHEYTSNGSLGNISFSKKFGTSPLHLCWDTRLKIARGISRGLTYLHDKKSVHGNLKPNNILLNADMEPKIGDFGLDKLIAGTDGNSKIGTSGRQFGSKRSMQTSISLPDLSPVNAGNSPCGSSTAALIPPNPYQAPESMKNLKPNAKWDVYSFGMILLELISGRVFSDVELCQWNSGLIVEDKNRTTRMIDSVIRAEVEDKDEVVLSCFKLGFSCCAAAPQKRPSMKEAMQLLEKMIPS